MTLLWAAGAPVIVAVDSTQRPVRFEWQGRAHRVAQIVQQWQVDVDWWAEPGRIWRAYTALITADGLFCVLYYDLTDDEWRLARLYD